MRRTLTTVHLALAAFFFPVALMFAFTGGLYTLDIKSGYAENRQTLALGEPLKPELALLVALAERVHERGEESKFSKLREVLRDPQFADEKAIIFTEHRDTQDFLVRRFEGLGLTGRIARIHGGMGFKERGAQVGRPRHDHVRRRVDRPLQP